jgi:hypothetical protein
MGGGQASRNLSARDDTVFFVHVPRTGGTALRHMLERMTPRANTWRIYDWQSENAAIGADLATVARYRLVVGHFRIGVWAPFADQPLLTVLRDPVARMLSFYRYTHIRNARLFHAPAGTVDFATFAASDPGMAFSNLQTYQLSSRVPAPERAGPEDDQVLCRLDLHEAIGSLTRPNVLPGITEDMERTVALMSVMLNIDPPAMVTANVSRDPTHEVDKPTRSLIRENNALDVELFNEATEIFWDKWRDAGASATAALERTRSAPNRRLQLWERHIDYLRRVKQSTQRITRR